MRKYLGLKLHKVQLVPSNNFFENEAGNAVAVNGMCYRDMLTNFVWSIINDMHISQMRFQQNGAAYHAATETFNLLQTKFPKRIILRYSAVNSPPKSCDLMSLDYFLLV